ncbi:MAG: putative toxin-antitoxin system toxin component, PIN family [Deltaproteobacteria bacterium]|nr:putative toxin-antitoxin system toxin component, PIN family [Deltaproteobacteria bacterium]
MTRIVCDTNVIVSAVVFGGPPRRVLELVSEGKVAGALSLAICWEVEAVLLRPKFGLTGAQVAAIIEALRDTFYLVSPQETVDAVPDDPDDNRVLEAALAAGADRVVTGDRHLLSLESYRGIRVLSPAEFLKEWEAR